MIKISEFFGILVMLFFRGETGKHNRPHIHILKSGRMSVFAIDDGDLLEGDLARSDRRRVKRWIGMHRDDLTRAWDSARAGTHPGRIEPLPKRKRGARAPRRNPAGRPEIRYRLVKGLPILSSVEWISGGEVRLCFTSNRIVEVVLPGVKDARKARIIDEGGGLDPGDGKGEFSSVFPLGHRGRVLLAGHAGKVYVPVRS